MFNKVFAIFLVSVSVGATAFAQDTATVTARPQGQTQVFTMGGGSYLGIQSQDVTKENYSKYGLKDVRGVAVEKVTENSPAAQAGLQNGDVIVRFNGEEVTSARKLTRLISEVAPDHQAKVTISRGGSERDVTVTVGKRPATTFGGGSFSIAPFGQGGQFRIEGTPQIRQLQQGMVMPRIQVMPQGMTIPQIGTGQNMFFYSNSRQIGVGLSSLGKQLGDYFGVADGKGILINSVRENSPAAKAGLKAGDVIVEVEGKSVSNPMELTRSMSEKTDGDVTLTIIRNKNRQTVRVTPEKPAAPTTTGSAFFTEAVPAGQLNQIQMMDDDDEFSIEM